MLKIIYYIIILVLAVVLLQPYGGTWAYELGLRWVYVFLIGFAISNLLAPACIRLGHKYNFLDMPNERKVHSHPVPRIGGIAIYLAFLAAIVRNLQFSREILGLVAGGTIIFILGLLDDIKPVSATVRMLFQAAAALVAVYFEVHMTVIPVSWPYYHVLNIALTLFWFIGILNAVNFLDGIDGLVTSFGVICSLLFASIAIQTGQAYLSWMCIALAGACLGFLPFNWTHARIFLGDSGATLIGFLLAGFAVFGTWTQHDRVVAFSTPLLILSIPIFDMIYTTISRVRNGSVKSFKQWLEYTGKDHFHHRLLKLGLSVPKSVGFIILLNICLGLGALIIRETGARGSLILLFQALVIFLIVVILMLSGRTLTED